ncbi:Fungalysin metallopeptidase-domain-containing protein [Paraphysoderma sedebokerense]|nr:Fungalysin metallopeptidase-domain-containing protein [Paraphysoderma sedebokerense]
MVKFSSSIILKLCLCATFFATAPVLFADAHRVAVKPFGYGVSHSAWNPQPESPQLQIVNVNSESDVVGAALKYFQDVAGVNEKGLVVKSVTETRSNAKHVYVQQVIDGLEVVNGVANINIGKDGKVFSFGNSFFPVSPSAKVARTPKTTPSDALSAVAAHLSSSGLQDPSLKIEQSSFKVLSTPRGAFSIENVPFASSPVNAQLKYHQVENGSKLELVWDMEVELKKADNWINVQVSAENNKLVGLSDWTADHSFNVYPLYGPDDPDAGDRTLVVNPEDPNASPKGWVDETRKQTVGPNVWAQDNRGNRNYGQVPFDAPRPKAIEKNGSLSFDFPLDLTKQPATYIDAAVSNLFYWCNIVHDVFYQYGFDEKSGNFQIDNNGKGGQGNDPVVANAQDGSGTNNANMATPPDGRSGRMRMYIWSLTTPNRDGDLEHDIIIHEYTHGISNRLTGGPANSNCLGGGEAGGMGEGWSDFFAVFLRLKPTDTRNTDIGMGQYVYRTRNPNGIRRFIYSTNMTTNPLTYAYYKQSGWQQVHSAGTIWATILYDVYWTLRDNYGYEPNLYKTKGDKIAGNILAMQLVIDGMKIQPCNPTMVQARDAIIQADEQGFGGAHVCDLWKAFAKRGLGEKAKSGGNADFTVPAKCQ